MDFDIQGDPLQWYRDKGIHLRQRVACADNYLGETLRRTISIRKAPPADDGSVTASLSSELPYERSWGTEVLSHEPEAINMGRAAEGLPLLWSHNVDFLIGRVTNIGVQNRRLVGTLIPGKSRRAQEIWEDVRAGNITDVSIGYTLDKIEHEENGSFVAKRWTPFEASLVAVPADPSVGIGRDLEKREYWRYRMEPPAPQTDYLTVQQSDDLALLGNVAFVDERYGRSIRDLDEYKDLVDRCLSRSIPFKEFFSSAMALAEEARKPTMATPAIHTNPTPDRFEETRVSVLDAVRAQIPEFNKREDFGLVHEQSQEMERQTGRTAKGIMVPDEALHTRTLSAGTATDGAELVATNLLAGSYVEVLRNQPVVAQAGATMIPGLVGNVAIPRQTAASTAAWLANEDDASSESEAQFDQITLAPKTVAAHTQITRQLLLQSTPAIEGVIRRDLSQSVAVAIDAAALNGDGTGGSPTGIKSTGDIGSVTFSAAAPTWAEVVQLETAVGADNALMGSLAYIMDSNGLEDAKTTERATNTGLFIFDNGTVNGYPALVSNNVVAEDWFFGNWADLIIGEWGGLDILVDPYTHSTRGRIIVNIFKTIDVAVRHPESFALGNDGA